MSKIAFDLVKGKTNFCEFLFIFSVKIFFEYIPP